MLTPIHMDSEEIRKAARMSSEPREIWEVGLGKPYGSLFARSFFFSFGDLVAMTTVDFYNQKKSKENSVLKNLVPRLGAEAIVHSPFPMVM